MITDIDEAEFSPCETPGAEPGVASSKWVVLRFAGGDLVPFESWRVLAAVARNRLREGLRPLIVHSAAGVSQDTESILRAAVLGDATKQIASLRDSYRKLAAGLEFDRGRDADRRLADYFAEIEALAAEVRRLREVSPRIHTRMLVLGELMSTRLGAAFLNSNGIEADWVDALELQNIADLSSPLTVGQHGLSGNVDLSPDPALSERLATCKGVVLTQARVAGHPDGGPPLPGPAGSDTTAAYLAARLPARRLEIWAGVAGIYTADPQLVPSARLLKELNFDEALELSASGSQAVSPSCLALSRRSGIPVFVRCTSAPQIAGTVISTVTNDNEPQIKGVST
ncbi:MAG: hypothetical protein KDI09_12685, partial [Halioglobus sp.]|nr:hypothetical protein [Halioglobus sp.]